jgi:hypothetical protein
MAPAVRVGISARPLHERNDGTLQLMAAVDNHSQVYRVMARSRGKGDPLEWIDHWSGTPNIARGDGDIQNYRGFILKATAREFSRLKLGRRYSLWRHL